MPQSAEKTLEQIRLLLSGIDASAALIGTASATATISNGGTLSTAAAVNKVSKIAVDGWTAASMTFQGSIDGVTFNDLYDEDGNLVTVPSFSGARVIDAPPELVGLKQIKVVSSAAQGAARTITFGASA